MTTIASLMIPRCPTAIAWDVIAIVIDALNRRAINRSWSHISKKVHKAISALPSFADSNPASAIMLIIGRLRISTAGEHAMPASIGWVIITIAMLEEIFAHNLVLATATGFGCATAQIFSPYITDGPAITFTAPQAIASVFKHTPLPKALSFNVYPRSHVHLQSGDCTIT